MTQSGQGDTPHFPAVPPAREGVVLPAHDDAWIPPQHTAPAAGQPWGQSWGPEGPLSPGEAPPRPPDADAEATRLIPTIPGGGPAPSGPLDQNTQFLGHRPLPAEVSSPDADATQYIAPVTAAGPTPPGRAPYGIRPGRPGDQQPPAEFEGLFRAEPGTAEPEATQQMPRFQEPQPQPRTPAPAAAPPQGRAARREAERRGLSRGALVGIVVAGCAVAGLAAGAALSSDGEETGKAALQSSAPSADALSASPADPAEQQARSLDALLEDSNDSRASVIKAVENIKACRDLGQAAADLRAAAEQRNGLVTRLEKLSVDRLPDHQALTASLTSAWKASAAADGHYAAWADQMANGKKGCSKGRARATGETAAGNRESGEATKAKQQAAGIWNAIAAQYGLKERQFTQL